MELHWYVGNVSRRRPWVWLLSLGSLAHGRPSAAVCSSRQTPPHVCVLKPACQHKGSERTFAHMTTMQSPRVTNPYESSDRIVSKHHWYIFIFSERNADNTFLSIYITLFVLHRARRWVVHKAIFLYFLDFHPKLSLSHTGFFFHLVLKDKLWPKTL